MKFEKVSSTSIPTGYQWPRYPDNKFVEPGQNVKITFEDGEETTEYVTKICFGFDNKVYLESEGIILEYASLDYPEPTPEENLIYDIIDYGRTLTAECIDYSIVREFVSKWHSLNDDRLCDDKDENC